jgi:hypothetical protein
LWRAVADGPLPDADVYQKVCANEGKVDDESGVDQAIGLPEKLTGHVLKDFVLKIAFQASWEIEHPIAMNKAAKTH